MAYEKDCKVVTTLSGTEYIRALAEDGSTVRIPVVDLAKALIESTVMLSSALLFRGIISYADYNLTTTAGIYSVQGLSYPTKPYEDYGTLLVLSPYVTQVYIRANSPTLLFRNKIGEKWSEWRMVSCVIL